MKIECYTILGSASYIIVKDTYKPIKYYYGMFPNNTIEWVTFLYDAKLFASREKAEEVLSIISLAFTDCEVIR